MVKPTSVRTLRKRPWLDRLCCMDQIFDVIPAKAGIQKNYSHPEFISGSVKEMLKQVQHDKEKPGFPPTRE